MNGSSSPSQGTANLNSDQHAASPPASLPHHQGVYHVTFWRTQGESLYLNIGNYREHVVLMGFRPMQNGQIGPLEQSGKLQPNDVLIGIQGQALAPSLFREVGCGESKWNMFLLAKSSFS